MLFRSGKIGTWMVMDPSKTQTRMVLVIINIGGTLLTLDEGECIDQVSPDPVPFISSRPVVAEPRTALPIVYLASFQGPVPLPPPLTIRPSPRSPHPIRILRPVPLGGLVRLPDQPRDHPVRVSPRVHRLAGRSTCLEG